MPDPDKTSTTPSDAPATPGGGDVVLTPSVLRGWPLPSSDGGKEARGRVLVVGGHVTMPGAVLLAAEAALRGGAGKLQVAAPEPIAIPLAIQLPEAMVAGLPTDADGDIAPTAADEIVDLAQGCAAVLIGPGISTPTSACALLEAVAPRLDVPVVIDALGMAFLTEHRDGLAHLDGRVVLSPNLTELSETLGEDGCDEEPRSGIARLAGQVGATVASGGGTTWIIDADGRALRDESGSPGLGVSGSGDVKAGVIAGLLARGADPLQAAAWATYAHGRAGERLAAQVGASGFLARELLAQIPAVLEEVA